MTVFYGSLRSVQFGISSILEIDKELTNLKKVTDASAESLREFTYEANEIGNALGKTTQEVIKASSEFARLGYSLEQSKVLAEEALLYSNVGDIDVETSSQNIISTVKGYGIVIDEEGKNVRKVIDIYNEVG